MLTQENINNRKCPKCGSHLSSDIYDDGGCEICALYCDCPSCRSEWEWEIRSDNFRGIKELTLFNEPKENGWYAFHGTLDGKPYSNFVKVMSDTFVQTIGSTKRLKDFHGLWVKAIEPFGYTQIIEAVCTIEVILKNEVICWVEGLGPSQKATFPRNVIDHFNLKFGDAFKWIPSVKNDEVTINDIEPIVLDEPTDEEYDDWVSSGE